MIEPFQNRTALKLEFNRNKSEAEISQLNSFFYIHAMPVP